MKPLVIDGRAPGFVPAYPLPGRARERRPLYVLERTVHAKTRHGWVRIPRGYVTDFASVPLIAVWATGLDLQALGPWAWAALVHDWLYAIGEPGLREIADDCFRERLDLDDVHRGTAAMLYRAVRLGGAGGYKKAPSWWSTENFADPETGAYPVPPPFSREEAFSGHAWGRRIYPNWPEAFTPDLA